MSTRLAEPAVLAAAKETLYPDIATNDGVYAVTDTQFTQQYWLDEWEIPDAVRARLRPFNALRLSSGEPDLLGVGMPAAPVLNRDAATHPVVAVEAKGDTATPATETDVSTGINQVHSRLSEVNLGYVAAPEPGITETTRALARDLNVGVVSVTRSGEANVVEPARIVGAGSGETHTTVEAIRFEASTHHLTEGSFPVNHPKNYLGYPLAVAATGDTDTLYNTHVINGARDARRGAQLLGLIDGSTGADQLTPLSEDIVRHATEWCGGPVQALQKFGDWHGSPTRFTKKAPKWGQLARRVVIQYPPTQLIVTALENLGENGSMPATLPDLAREALRLNQPLAVEVFFTTTSRDRVLDEDGDVIESRLLDPVVYKSGIHFQFKAQLFHAGLLKDTGTDSSEEAVTDEWELTHPIHKYTTKQ